MALLAFSGDFARGSVTRVSVETLSEARAVSCVVTELLGKWRALKDRNANAAVIEAQERYDKGEPEVTLSCWLGETPSVKWRKALAGSHSLFETGVVQPKLPKVTWNPRTSQIEYKGTIGTKTLVQAVATVEQARAVAAIVDRYHSNYKDKYGQKKRRSQLQLF